MNERRKEIKKGGRKERFPSYTAKKNWSAMKQGVQERNVVVYFLFHFELERRFAVLRSCRKRTGFFDEVLAFQRGSTFLKDSFC